MIQQTRAFKKRVAWSLLICMIMETMVYPTSAYALTSGPSQPEFQKFTPVATTNMVNPFTGDFQYNLPVLNVPGADGGGYALSLSYDANPAMGMESSWVGHNWTLNPGALSRSKKGLPDDYKGEVTEYNQIKPTWTFTRTDGAGVSVNISKDNESKNGSSGNGSFGLGVSYNVMNSFNNISGYSQVHSIGLGGSFNVKDAPLTAGVGASFNISGRDVTFDASVSIGLRLNKKIKEGKRAAFQKEVKEFGKSFLKQAVGTPKLTVSMSGIFAHTGASVAASVKPHRGLNLTFGGTAKLLLGPVTASYNRIQNFNLQASQPQVDYQAYGYMYNPNKTDHVNHDIDGDHVMSDFGIEKNSTYSPRDKIIGIPYNNADYFNAIGEGLAGTYRLHHNKVGHYYPDFLAGGMTKDPTIVPSINGGGGFVLNDKGDAGLGLTLGATFQFINKSTIDSKRWLLRDETGHLDPDHDSKVDFYEFDGSLPFFRAKNDMGGALLYAELNNTDIFPNPDDLQNIVKDFRGGFFGKIKSGSTQIDGGTDMNVPNISKYIAQERYTGASSSGGPNDDYYKGQASYMEYVRNVDLHDTINGGIDKTKAFEKSDRILKFIDEVPASPSGTKIDQNGSVANLTLKEHIAQIKVWNPDGNQYTYGLPVYVRDEASFSYGVDITGEAHWGNGADAGLGKKIDPAHATGAQEERKGTIAYPDVAEEGDLEIKLGQELKEWYANTYLMTQITTPDYVDLKGDGPTTDDFGGYTAFDYRRWTRGQNVATEAYNNWYRFRTPYTGLDYQKNEQAKKGDDMGTVSSGLRENYYLNAVETKSHIAIFITNKTDASKDFAHLDPLLAVDEYDGSGDIRYDGLGQVFETPADAGAGTNNAGVTDFPANNGTEFTLPKNALNEKDSKGGDQDVEKLEKIILFAKSDLSKPLVTTHFDYDYSSWTNVFNNYFGRAWENPVLDENGMNNSGKLTLKKVWFEYQGVKSYKVSPYQFEYEYKKATDFDAVIQSRYPHLFGATGDWPSYNAGAETPNFSPEAMGRWGNWAYDGENRRLADKHWLYQGNYTQPKDYDPAAWMLKQIKLPSGGEILVQYEEKTYHKVQDQKALGMISLKPIVSYDDDNVPDASAPGEEQRNKFYLNLEEMGIAGDIEKKKFLVDVLRHMYMKKKDVAKTTDPANANYYRYEPQNVQETAQENRVYFKFKYRLDNDDVESEEYISGYAIIRSVGVDADGVYLSIGNPMNNGWFADRKDIPRQLCYDYIQYVSHKNTGFEYQDSPIPSTATFNYYAFKNNVEGSGNPSADLGAQAQFDRMDQNFAAKSLPEYVDACKYLNYEASYIRVPLVNPKRGGGVRVKRVLMYDEGMESGDAQLFGTEYDYVREDGTCSGVATNEPMEGREENALIHYEKRNSQDFFSKIFAGRDREEGEMPYGEFMLPPPAVNYSRIVMSNINLSGDHTASKQSGGFTVKEYFTHDYYPTKMYFDANKDDYGILNGSSSVEQTNLGGGQPHDYDKRRNYRRGTAIPLSLGIFNYNLDYRWLAQSFLFIQTNMNGQVRAESTYGGTYDRLYFSNRDLYFSSSSNPNISLTSRVAYDYYQPGEKVPTLSYDAQLGEYKMKERHLGLEDDITMTAQAVYDQSIRSSMDLGLLVTYFGAFKVSPQFGFNFTFGEKGMARHMTTRSLYFPAIVKSVETTMNNASSVVEHLAFSELTGSPILSKTTDGYDRTIVADYSDPANPQTVLHSGEVYNWNLPAAWFYPSMGQKALDPTNTNQLTGTVGSVTSYGEEGNPLAHASGVNGWAAAPKNVLGAKAMTLRKGDWFDDGSVSGVEDPIIREYVLDPTTTTQEISSYATTLNELYRVDKTYIYDPTTEASSANDKGALSWGEKGQKAYNSGFFDHFAMFDWGGTNSDWTVISEVSKYSPNGSSLEERNVIADIPSAAKYGYNKFLNTALAQNGEYNTIGFESFEDETFQGQFSATPSLKTSGHAGENGLKLGTTPTVIIDNLVVSNRVLDPMLGNGFMVRLWAKNELVGRNSKVLFGKNNHLNVQLVNSGTTIATASNEKKIAQVGEWVLLEFKFDVATHLAGITAGTTCALQLGVTGVDFDNNALSSIDIDDVRIQPTNSEMTTNVYSPKSFQLIASFGSEHFGSFYQYNDEGGLVRTLIETEQGTKTIQENQGHTPATYQVTK
ncbi:hypothetical protein [Aureispira anguillae]|uniref:Cell surface protein SprA n=1 Tax=Aureispira anguillae TaxID=2864201 RepID=A0A915YCC8_9BACT|nr:hypothetical protein [Aureispira anguillae]BDS10487.1 hypothetical protein AsAng_0011950 [Aureispira anguillae]